MTKPNLTKEIEEMVKQLYESGYCEASHDCLIEHPKIIKAATKEFLSLFRKTYLGCLPPLIKRQKSRFRVIDQDSFNLGFDEAIHEAKEKIQSLE